MKDLLKDIPWYSAGLAFECTGCGRCCSGPEEGYVWATDKEIAAMARLLEISVDQMNRRYVRKVGRRKSLKENKANNDCVFLVPDGQGGKKCSVYQARPQQCRTWPFWPSNLDSLDDWAWAGGRCPGINRGKLFSFAEIEERKNSTQE